MKIPTGTIGATSELAVCVDLMHKGWHVFRATSPNAPVDLVGLFKLDDDEYFHVVHIEVKTGKWWKGNLQYAKPRNSHWDLLAVVVRDDIHYFLPNGRETFILHFSWAEAAKKEGNYRLPKPH